ALRTAVAADVPAILAMMADFNRGEGIAWEPARGEAPLRRLLGDPALGTVGLAESAGAPVGYFVVTWGYDLEGDGRDGFLTEIYLVPEARRRGAGRALLLGVERAARDAGAHALHLMVRHENAPAIALYEGAGYTTPARRFMTKVLRS